MIRALILAPLCLIPALAWSAPWRCDFTVACVAAGDCAAADLEAELLAADHEGQLFLQSGGLPMPATALSGPGDTMLESFASLGVDAAGEILTVYPDRTALLSTHAAGAMATTYFGSCEAL